MMAAAWSPNPPLALYIHIPFCAARCPYCDFNTYAGLERFFDAYTNALEAEIRRAGAVQGPRKVHTVYIGGGTPTVLPPQLLARVLNACRAAFDVMQDAEITSEANPGTVDQAHFVALRALGINRLSLGVQSFDDEELRWLGRIHSATEAVAAYSAARAAGFSNINLDLMFGLPGQAPATWQRTLETAAGCRPEHLSLYSLTVEHGTPLAGRVSRRQVAAPDDDLAADLYLSAGDFLARRGYVQYEISNWARDSVAEPTGPGSTAGEEPGTGSWHDSVACVPARASGPRLDNPFFACRHNLVYWRAEPYLGFGAGAHSYDGHRRGWNVKTVPAYLGRLQKGRSPVAGGEHIDTRLAQGETMMLGLRLLLEGVARSRFRQRFGVTLEDLFGSEVAALTQRGLLELVEGHLRLTPRGRLLGNQVFAEFLPCRM